MIGVAAPDGRVGDPNRTNSVSNVCTLIGLCLDLLLTRIVISLTIIVHVVIRNNA